MAINLDEYIARKANRVPARKRGHPIRIRMHPETPFYRAKIAARTRRNQAQAGQPAQANQSAAQANQPAKATSMSTSQHKAASRRSRRNPFATKFVLELVAFVGILAGLAIALRFFGDAALASILPPW